MLAAGLLPEASYLGYSVQVTDLHVDSNPLLGLRRLLSIPISLARSNYFGMRSYTSHPVALDDLSHIHPRSPETPGQ
jgi:hypothetical protein